MRNTHRLNPPKCRRCNKQLHVWDYLGANPEHDKHYYRCPDCGTITIVTIQRKTK